jgi:hypothetical protein
MSHREIMQQALEALWGADALDTDMRDAITALRNALEQPQQGPSQWRDMVVVNLVREGINKHKARELADHFATPPAAQPEQVVDCPRCGHVCSQRKWVGLTNEEIAEILCDDRWQMRPELMLLACQAKLKERNT